MTDRINAVTVTLETNMREDDAESLISAIKQLRGVLSVTPNVADITSHIAEQRARDALGEKLLAIVYPDRGGT